MCILQLDFITRRTVTKLALYIFLSHLHQFIVSASIQTKIKLQERQIITLQIWSERAKVHCKQGVIWLQVINYDLVEH